MKHLKTGNAYFAQGSYKSYKYNGKELQETGMYSYGWREYMPDIGRWNGIDQLAEDYFSASPYAYVLNNPISMFDPDGRVTMAAITASMLSETPDGSNSYWYNNGTGFTSYDGGPKGGGGGGSLAYGSTVSYGGMFTMGDGVYTLPPLVLSGYGSSQNWGGAISTYNINHGILYNGIAGMQSAWNWANQPNQPFDRMSWVRSDGPIQYVGGAGDPFGVWEVGGMALSGMSGGKGNYILAALMITRSGNTGSTLKLLNAERGILNTEVNVVRGGTCLACQFENGSGVIVDAKGLLNGVSVNSTKGLSISELSVGIPNGKIGTTTVSQIEALGGKITASPTKNNPFHSTLSGLTAKQAEKLFNPTIKNPLK